MRRFSVLAIAALVLIGTTWLLFENVTVLGLFVGRFHSLLVHFPIALVLLAALVEFFRGGRDRDQTGRFEAFLLLTASASAAAAVLTGFLLSYEGGFAEGVVYWHLRLGLVVAFGIVVALILHRFQVSGRRGWLSWSHRVCLGSTALAVVITGHLGGTLAHGPDYLTEYLPAPLKGILGLQANSGKRASVDLETTGIFEGIVAPVLGSNCLECHSDTRRRGGISLASAGAIREGGEGGPAVVPGDSRASELIRRITLPPDDEDRMPPGDREPLDVGAVELIRWWIDEGASADQTIADARTVPFPVQIHLDRVAVRRGPSGGKLNGAGLAPPDPALLRALEDGGFVVAIVAEGSPLLTVRLPSGQILDDSRVKALQPLADHIIWLDLSGVSLKERAATAFSGLENLRRLNLSLSDISSDGMPYLSGLSRLEYLNLYGTGIGDSGLRHLVPLKNLRSLYLWQTQVSPEAVERLAAELPRCAVSLGAEGDVTKTPSAPPSDRQSGD